MKITVITPVRNNERFIRQTIESVLSQEGDFEIEYIIRDGLSTDNTLAIAREYDQDPRLKIISEKDESHYDAINKGFQEATGEIGCWINADDYYEPGTLQRVVEEFRADSKLDWLYGRCDIVDENGAEIRQLISRYKDMLGWKFFYWLLLCENFINQPATFWRMSLWREVEGVDLRYPITADYHLWLKMGRVSSPKPVKQVFAHFRRCGESIGDTLFEKQFEEQYVIARQFAGPITSFIHRLNCWKIVTAYRLLAK